MSGSGTVAMDVTYDPVANSFTFTQVANSTGNNVVVVSNGGSLVFEVNLSGAYSLAFNASNFELANPPVIFEGSASWLALQQGYDTQQFTLLLINPGFVLEEASFSIQEANGGTVDPTVVNNPNPPGTAAQAQRERKQAVS